MADRVYFASHGLAINGTGVAGAQSVGISMTFNNLQAFQLGTLSIYDNIVTDGEVTVSATKNLDGNSLMFPGGNVGDYGTTTFDILVASSDDEEGLDGTGQTATEVTGAFLSSLGYTFPVDTWATEEISFVGDNKSVATGTISTLSPTTGTAAFRHHYSWSGVHANENVTNISINTDFAREALFKLGQFNPYYRFANFPIEITVEFTYTNTGIDETVLNLEGESCTGSAFSKTDITVDVCQAPSGTAARYSFTASGCVLSSINQEGGGTDGGNATTTVSYTTYNDLLVVDNS